MPISFAQIFASSKVEFFSKEFLVKFIQHRFRSSMSAELTSATSINKNFCSSRVPRRLLMKVLQKEHSRRLKFKALRKVPLAFLTYFLTNFFFIETKISSFEITNNKIPTVAKINKLKIKGIPFARNLFNDAKCLTKIGCKK